MMTDRKKGFKAEMKRSSRSLGSAKKKLAAYLRQNLIDDDIISQVDLALYEIVANIIEHDGAGYRRFVVTVTCSIGGGAIEMAVRYKGKEFDITGAPLPDIKAHVASGRDSGLGIYIIRTLMDSVGYSHRDGMNTIVCTKDIPGAS